MKKYFTLFILIIINLSVFAQKMETDIFGDLKYESRNGQYKATLKKDIFDDLTFSDNNKNKVVFKKKYLDLEYRNVLGSSDIKIDFFRDLVHKYQRENNYEITYSVDIFDKTVIEDNRNNKTEIGTDIFGNMTYNEKWNGFKYSIKTDISGQLNFESDRDKATLKKDIFNKWVYKDSSDNKIELSERTWNNLLDRYGNNENIFMFLIDEFLFR